MEAEAAISRPKSYAASNREIIRVLFKPSVVYVVSLLIVISMVLWGVYSWYMQIRWGMGVDGMNQASFWGVYIVTFVFWIGIGHAGTLISAILFLVRSRWRTGVYRASEAMTVFAVMTAAMFPLIHLGRVWQLYWMFPYPNQRQIWVNFKSPLMWDVFAISTYFTISLVFFYVGLLPDMAVVRDHASGFTKRVYNMFCLGWRGTSRQWHHYMAAYGFFAAFAAPLVLSVHSVVSWDFAMAHTPGWHSTIFPPYFVAGAIFSGCAMVLTLTIPMSRIFGWKEYINVWHFENLAKMCLLTSAILSYAYVMEYFTAWYSQNAAEWEIFRWRVTGELAWAFYLMVFCNCVVPLLFYFKRVRTSLPALFVISIVINVGMWMERFNIIVSSTAHSFDPNMWRMYSPTIIEIGILVGSVGWFMMWFLLFSKTLPAVAITEVKEMVAPPVKGSLEAA
ncbi:MAG: polysulfide reductase NrfD [Deltaproteobacteria bacterium]|nr:polysulfide reductase NrfD [Deltaproteobacteria bacterium]